MKEGRLVGESMHGVREGVQEEGRAQWEIYEGGEAGRGRAWSKGMDGVLEGGKEEGGRQGDKGVREGVADRRGGRREGREGARHQCSVPGMGYAQKHASGC